jgi:septal ring factor EnvC (AmiA/AmiB activator)
MKAENSMSILESLTARRLTIQAALADATTAAANAKQEYGQARAEGRKASWSDVEKHDTARAQLQAELDVLDEQIAQATAQVENDRVKALQARIEQLKAQQNALLGAGATRKSEVASLVAGVQSLLTAEDKDRATYNAASAELVQTYAQLGVTAAYERPTFSMPGNVQPSVIVARYPGALAAKALNPLRKVLAG